MVLGLDAPIPSRVRKYALEGKLPTLKRLMESGVYAENCLVPYPTITSSNWTTIATGAWPGTHGITGYSVHLPGDPLDEIHDGFDSHDNQAEALWTVAERIGKRSIVFDWPAAWPATVNNGADTLHPIVIGGSGAGVNSWRYAHDNERRGVSLASYQLFSTEEYPFARVVKFSPASGWKNLADGSRALEARADLYYNAPPQPAANTVEPKSWHLLLQDTQGQGYDKALLSESKNAEDAFASLSVGEWSDTIVQKFETSKGTRSGAFKCKLMELSRDGRSFKLYVTIINALEGWSYPESIAAEITSQEGLPSPRDGYVPLLLDWIDQDTFVEVVESQHLWTADAVSYLLSNKPWDLFFIHTHCPDWMYHTFSVSIDPLTAHSREEAARYAQLELTLYQSLDRMLDRVLACADEETLLIVVSDHGAKASTRGFQVVEILKQAGLTAIRGEGGIGSHGVPLVLGTHGGFEVDWSQTKAYPQRICYIYVNLKGRDPQGIVEPGEEYEEVREQIIRHLYDYTDPQTGKKPIALALKREDARILGLYGDRVGDVVYALNPEFGGEHGNFLPAVEHGIGSMKGLLIMCGPGIRQNAVLQRTVWLTDVVPTICYLAELPVPRDTEGAIIYQALEEPNLKLEELTRLRQNYARVTRAFMSGEAETHRHGI